MSGHGNSPQRVSGLWNPNARNERTLTERSGDDSPKGLLSVEREDSLCTKQILAFGKQVAKNDAIASLGDCYLRSPKKVTNFFGDPYKKEGTIYFHGRESIHEESR